jgi:O-antigen/teichoic acid export membrane protein
LITLLTQGIGALAVLGTVALLGVTLGPAAQGLFSRSKAEIEFVGALALLGLPQSLFYFYGSGRLNIRQAQRCAVIGGLIGVVCASAYAYVVQTKAITELLLVSLAVGTFTVHGSLRSLVLAARSSFLFNIVTALPQLLLVAYALVAVVSGSVDLAGIAIGFAAAFGIASMLAWLLLRNVSSTGPVKITRPEIMGLASFGAATWLTATCLTLSTVVAMRSVEKMFGPQALGIFGAALVIQQLLLTPSNYVTPLLFKRWIGGAGSDVPARLALILAGSVLLFAAIIGFASTIVDGAWTATLGRYDGLQHVALWVAIAAAADSAQKILAVASNASGLPWIPAIADASRLGLVGIVLTLWGSQSLTAVAVLWAAAAMLAATMTYVGVKSCEAARKRA